MVTNDYNSQGVSYCDGTQDEQFHVSTPDLEITFLRSWRSETMSCRIVLESIIIRVRIKRRPRFTIDNYYIETSSLAHP